MELMKAMASEDYRNQLFSLDTCRNLLFFLRGSTPQDIPSFRSYKDLASIHIHIIIHEKNNLSSIHFGRLGESRPRCIHSC